MNIFAVDLWLRIAVIPARVHIIRLIYRRTDAAELMNIFGFELPFLLPVLSVYLRRRCILYASLSLNLSRAARNRPKSVHRKYVGTGARVPSRRIRLIYPCPPWRNAHRRGAPRFPWAGSCLRATSPVGRGRCCPWTYCHRGARTRRRVRRCSPSRRRATSGSGRPRPAARCRCGGGR